MKTAIKYTTVNEYFATLPSGLKKALSTLRKTIHKAAPEAEEVISYNMPAFKFQGILVYYAACQSHVGFYPTSSPIKAFKNELKEYDVSKGTIRFPLDRPIPHDLVTKIVQFRLAENLNKIKNKSKVAG